jgi:hypothetical protein
VTACAKIVPTLEPVDRDHRAACIRTDIDIQ